MITEGHFDIPRNIFDPLLPKAHDKRRLQGDWTDILYSHFNSFVPTCPLKFTYNHVQTPKLNSKNPIFWSGKSVCKIGGSQVEFLIKEVLPDRPVTVYFKSDRKCVHQKTLDGKSMVRAKRHLKGRERQKVVEQLLLGNTTPSSLYRKKLEHANREEISAGNRTSCHSTAVLRQAKYLYKLRAAQSIEDDFHELVVMKETFRCALGDGAVKGYIQTLCHGPRVIDLYCQRQIDHFVRSCRRGEFCLLDLVCSGNIVEQVPNERRPFLYSFLLNSTDVSVFDFISTDTSDCQIESRIAKFLSDARRGHRARWCPHVVATDFSFAALNACATAFNRMTLSTYVSIVYDVMTGRAAAGRDEESVQTIHWIRQSHVMKMLANRLSKRESDNDKIATALMMFSRLMDSTSLEEALESYRNCFVLLNATNETGQTARALRFFRESPESGRGNLSDLCDGSVSQSDPSSCADSKEEFEGELKSMRRQSPFADLFRKATEISFEEGSKANGHFSPRAFKAICEFVPLFPLYSRAAISRLRERLRRTKDVPQERFDEVFVRSHLEGGIRSALTTTTKRRRKMMSPKMFVFDNFAIVRDRLKPVQPEEEARGTSRRKREKIKSSNDEEGDSGQRGAGKRPRSDPAPTPDEVVVRCSTPSTMSADSERDNETRYDELELSLEEFMLYYTLKDELSSDEVDDFMIRCHHLLDEEVGGLQMSGLGVFKWGQSQPCFAAVKNKFVQILNIGDHWICCSNVHSGRRRVVRVYDSVTNEATIGETTKVLISNILRLNDSEGREKGEEEDGGDEIVVEVRSFPRQEQGSRACGYYACAAAYLILNGVDASLLVDCIDKIKELYFRVTSGQQVDLREYVNRSASDDTLRYVRFKRIVCLCQGEARARLLRCRKCYKLYHSTCVTAGGRTGPDWEGPCCLNGAGDGVEIRWLEVCS